MIGQIFQKISIWIILLPVLAGTMNFKGMGKDSRWIFLLVLLAITPQVLTVFDKEDDLLHISYNLYMPLEFFILYKIFSSKYRSKVARYIVGLSFCVSVAFYLFSAISFGLKASFLNGAACVGNSTYILWSLLLLKQEYESEETLLQRTNPFTWYFIAILLYAPCTLASLAFYYYIRDQNSPILTKVTIIFNLFNILMYIFFSFGLLIRKKH